MNVGEKDIVNLTWRNRKMIPVSVGKIAFLKQAAVHKDLQATGFKEITRACHLACGA